MGCMPLGLATFNPFGGGGLEDLTELFGGDIFFMNKQKEMKERENKKYNTITNDKKIDQIIFELNQMKNVY